MADIEMIGYSLEVIGVDDEVSALIAQTICRLPEELQDRVVSELIFICVDTLNGMYHRNSIPVDFQKRETFDFIILNLSQIEDEEEKMFVIAHEIGHFILGHWMWNPEITKDRDIEQEADSLAEQWGFIVPERRKG